MDKQAQNTELVDKLDLLKNNLAALGSVVIAYSGGVDSTFLLRVARDVLDENVLAVTILSQLHTDEEVCAAQENAERLGVRHITTTIDVLSNANVSSNPPDRCYHCKMAIMGEMLEIAKENGIAYVADGSNADDIDTYRPGRGALIKLGIISPLKDAGLTKDDIREMSKRLGLATWDKPANPCLATRFPYGTQLTVSGLERVRLAEEIIADFIEMPFRVRIMDDTARIEVLPERFVDLLDNRDYIIARFKDIGFTYTTVDIEGFRSGSMDAKIDME